MRPRCAGHGILAETMANKQQAATERGTEERWMRRAIKLASENVHRGKGGPFGAVIVKNGQLVAEGANQVTTSNDPTAHGEVVAIRAACKALGTYQLAGCILYTSAEPCPMCLAAGYWAHLDSIFYGNTIEGAAIVGFADAHLYREMALPLAARSMKMTQLLPKEAAESFALWRESPLRVDY